MAVREEGDSHRESAGTSAGLDGQQSVHVEGDMTADGEAQNPSAARFGPTSHLKDPRPFECHGERERDQQCWWSCDRNSNSSPRR